MFSSKNLYQILCKLTSQRKFLIAYSGGLDSHVLLHAMYSLRKNYPEMQLTAVHVHHGLSANANIWAKHCRQICQSLSIDCVVKKIKIEKNSEYSLEEVARTERYQVLAELLKPDTCLLTAHTKDDQAETLLLQLFRGAGPKGLAAMPEIKSFAASQLIRPLLSFTRAELQQYAADNQLTWIEDESNDNQQFDRNYIRHELLPIMQKRWPGIMTTLARTARHCAESSALVSCLAQQDLQKMQDNVTNKLSIVELLALDLARQRNVLREWLRQLNFSIPNEAHLLQIQQEILLAKEDADPVVSWDNVEIRRYQDNLYAMSPLPLHDVSWNAKWNMQQPLKLPGNLGSLDAKKILAQGLMLPKKSKIEVRFRQGGERCQPVGRKGSHPLKKLFQEWEVPTWERERVPLIFVNDKLAMVVGYCIDEKFFAKETATMAFAIPRLDRGMTSGGL